MRRPFRCVMTPGARGDGRREIVPPGGRARCIFSPVLQLMSRPGLPESREGEVRMKPTALIGHLVSRGPWMLVTLAAATTLATAATPPRLRIDDNVFGRPYVNTWPRPKSNQTN